MDTSDEHLLTLKKFFRGIDFITRVIKFISQVIKIFAGFLVLRLIKNFSKMFFDKKFLLMQLVAT